MQNNEIFRKQVVFKQAYMNIDSQV